MSSGSNQTALGAGSLLLVTLIWAFSFGIIGSALKGIDPFFIGAIRLATAGLCFLPFLRLGEVSVRQRAELVALGAIQFGVMYVAYLSAYRFLESWQVALFSVLTPLWVTFIDATLNRRIKSNFILAAILSVVGAALIRAKGDAQGDFITGFLLMQLANIAFAVGQVWFREWKFRHRNTSEKSVFALLYLGALLLVLSSGLVFGDLPTIPEVTGFQWSILIYLGIVASGAGFFLWNFGASRVSTGFLAASNNLVVPFGVVIAILLDSSNPNYLTLVIGSLFIAFGLWVGKNRPAKA